MRRREHSEVPARPASLIAIEPSQTCFHVGTPEKVNPLVAVGFDLQAPGHVGIESNGRAGRAVRAKPWELLFRRSPGFRAPAARAPLGAPLAYLRAPTLSRVGALKPRWQAAARQGGTSW